LTRLWLGGLTARRSTRGHHRKVVTLRPCHTSPMSDWETIETIVLRGGPLDGDRLEWNAAQGLADVLDLLDGDQPVRYRKSGEYTQMGSADMAPYSRNWFYDWVPSH